MKRYGNLWADLVSFQNLLDAARHAQRGKRFRPNVLRFNYNLETELLQLQQQLLDQTYQPGTYRTFRVKEPKSRLISAAPYRDRVVHHALRNHNTPGNRNNNNGFRVLCASPCTLQRQNG
jgi:hypothetical protein